MRRRTIASAALFALFGLSACTLMPHYRRPQSPVAEQWPADTGNPRGAAATGVSADEIGWKDFFTDPRLQSLVQIALANNRNLRVAVLNVAASQAQFRIERGNLFPAIAATGSGLVDKLPANGAAPSAQREASAVTARRTAPEARPTTITAPESASPTTSSTSLAASAASRRRRSSNTWRNTRAAAARRSASSRRWRRIISRCSLIRRW